MNTFICGKCKAENDHISYERIVVENGKFDLNKKVYKESSKSVKSLRFFCPTCKAEIEDESFILMLIGE